MDVYQQIEQALEKVEKQRTALLKLIDALADPVVAEILGVKISDVKPEPVPVIPGTITIADLNLALLPVPAGSFMMGSEDGDRDEKPVHKVTLTKPYWLGKIAVTQAQYEKLMGHNPSKLRGADNPVRTVSWEEATEFCAKLTAREREAGCLPVGYEYRLPTEAEWEYAARGGPQSKGYTYSGSNTVGDVAGHDDNSGGKKRTNELGLQDIFNGWEWCYDWLGSYPSGSVSDPRGPATGSHRANRGGVWGSRIEARLGGSPEGRSSSVGFRLALAPEI